jgi:glucose-1-phosphate cytidylyltransferase
VRFNEKPPGAAGWVNGGFFVAEPSILDYIDDDTTVFERTPLERLSADSELAAYKHDGYWHGMDTLWDKMQLNSLWTEGKAPWKTWDD